MTQIPIYRAKKTDNDEWFIGYLLKYGDGYYIKLLYDSIEIMIDPSTLAIYFPQMIDKNGKKIFASLSEDGIGSDLIVIDDVKYYMEIIGSSVQLCDANEDEVGNSDTLEYDDYHRYSLEEVPYSIEVIGIHKDKK